jgi:hypothetical protein
MPLLHHKISRYTFKLYQLILKNLLSLFPSGHCHLRKHLHRLGIYKEEPVCRKYVMGEEIAQHILFEFGRTLWIGHQSVAIPLSLQVNTT